MNVSSWPDMTILFDLMRYAQNSNLKFVRCHVGVTHALCVVLFSYFNQNGSETSGEEESDDECDPEYGRD